MGIFQQFPYTNFHEMNLDQIIKIMREMQDEWAATKTEWASYKDFIDNYFDTIDVSTEILQALRVMAASGELNEVVDPVIVTEVTEWLTEHITPTTPAIDDTLTIAGAAADAKAAGDRINENTTKIKYLTSNNVSWVDGFISSATGTLLPATADAEKTSNFISVFKNTHCSAIVKFNSAHYRDIYISGFNEEKTFVRQVKRESGSVLNEISIDADITDSSIKFIRITFKSFNDVDTVNTDVFYNLDKILEYINTENNSIIQAAGIGMQYINYEKWIASSYYNWNPDHTGVQLNASSDTWKALKITGLPAGTYYYNNFCAPGFSFIENTTNNEFHAIGDYGVTQPENGVVTINHPFNLYLTLNTNNASVYSAMFANATLPQGYQFGLYKPVSYMNKDGNMTWIVGQGYIPTISEACNRAAAGDSIFIKCGTYEEQVSIWNKKLHLIGENKANTVLIDHSGNYDTPPLEMSLGSLSNMTIIEDGSDPTGTAGDGKYMMAYCLHIEWEPPANEIFVIDNCDFINHIHAPVGCGLYQSYTVHFKNCTFKCLANNEGANERGSFYFHTCNSPNVTDQNIIAENCIISSAGVKWAVLLGVPSGANNSGAATARFSNCCIWNDNLGTADQIAYFDTSGGANVLEVVHSYGNTVSALNNA